MTEKNTDISHIQVNQLVGYLPQPTPEPQRYVVRVKKERAMSDKTEHLS